MTTELTFENLNDHRADFWQFLNELQVLEGLFFWIKVGYVVMLNSQKSALWSCSHIELGSELTFEKFLQDLSRAMYFYDLCALQGDAVCRRR